MREKLNREIITAYFALIGCIVASICAVAVGGAGMGMTGLDAVVRNSEAQRTDPLSDPWTLQGHVYAGGVGDESHPLQGVTVSAYGANDPYPASGTFITSTTTDATGWYGLAVSEGYEFYHLSETDPWGFSSAGATTVGGTVRTSNWIEFAAPLAGKTLTGNKFWDQPMYTLSGRVYRGEVGNESVPLSGVTVELYGSNNEGDVGTVIDSITTNTEGWYGLIVSTLREFYTIVESDPTGYDSVGATSVDGTVVTSNRIRYAYPLDGQTLTDNKFWDQPMIDLIIPTDDLYITANTTLVPGSYTIADAGANGAIIINASNVVLDCNGAVLNGSGSGYGIYNPGFDNVKITNCTVLNYDRGIFLHASSDYTRMYNNNLSGNDEYGVEIYSSTGTSITDNVITTNGVDGIFLYNADAGSIGGNTITGNTYGLYIFDDSDSNEITANEIVENLNTGVYISNCDPWGWCPGGNSNNYLGENVIVDNGNYGIYSNASDSTIESNTVCNNGLSDFASVDWLTSSGGENSCDMPNGWNDAGTTGCRYSCPAGESDLGITDIWFDGEFIRYQVRNIGNDTAPGGHWTGLLIDEVYVMDEHVTVALEPGERYNGFFDYEWWCTDGDDALTAVADYYDQVPEHNEINNLREEVWKCDVTPPRITAGPRVQNVTSSSALITWGTDEASDSVVRYGTAAGVYESEESDPALELAHAISLNGLAPSTTYQVTVHSSDASGNSVTSRNKIFETLPTADGTDPEVAMPDPGVCNGTVIIAANATDNLGVEKVEFFIDDQLIFTDFSDPFELPLNTCCYGNGNYTLTAKVVDLAGNSAVQDRVIGIENFVDTATPTVKIFNPYHGATVAGQYPVWVHVEDDSGWSEVEYFVDGTKIGGGTYPVSPSLDIGPFWWDTRFLANDGYTLAVRATDKTNKTGLDTVVVYVSNTGTPLRPELAVIRHEVTRHLNTFAVELEVENQGTATAYEIELEDFLSALQPVSRANFNAADYKAEYISATNRTKCVITDNVSMSPGSSRTYTYMALPVLMHPSQPQPEIGMPVKLSYSGSTGQQYSTEVTYTVPKTTANVPLATAFDQALKQADYLIVTNPSFLIFENPFQRDEVDALLSDMGKLASERNGVLGYLYVNNETTLRTLIKPTGSWTKKLDPNFSKSLGGYLLIVGETEIIPARFERGFALGWSNSNTLTQFVPFSDHPYTDTNDDGVPDLIVGRIIGNDALNLSKAIQTSIGGYSFDRSNALVVSGTDGDASIQKMFTDGIDTIEDKLKNNGFTVTPLQWKNYPTNAGQLQAFRTNATDKDVVCYDGHGGVDAWCWGLQTTDFPVNFGTTSPFVLSLACLTGSYENHPTYGGGDYNIAEAFLDSSAAVFIGATQVSSVNCNGEAGKWYFAHWDADETIGEVFTELERGKYSTKNSYWGLWVWEYNLYGDPKFGVVSTGASAGVRADVPLEATATLEVVVPDYVVTTSDEVDYVDIPGGELLLENGSYQVPYYTVSTDYPRGYTVQNVTLRERTGLQTATGLNLPITTIVLAAADTLDAPAPNQSEDWFPNETYRWRVVENPDGTSTLVMTLYPFSYNPLTTTVRFYQNYSFEINYTESGVTVDLLRTDKDAYEQGETVTVDLGLNNTGDAEDIIVSALITRYGSEDPVDGLLLSTLSNFSGLASYSLQWNSSGFEPGDYVVEVILRDAEGNVLDSKTVQFWLGIAAGEITALTATPEQFEIGDEIGINMTFANTGTVNLTGTAIVRVSDVTGGAVEEYRQNVTGLLPSDLIRFCNTWNTTGAAEGVYNILGYVLYEGRSTDPVSIMVSTETGGFDTGTGTYPSIAGTHTGTITPNQTMVVHGLYTYPCRGTGGHTEYVKIWQGTKTLVEAEWAGYSGDWQNITFDTLIVLEANETYYYTITTGSYPQLIHEERKDVAGGTITCTQFTDGNGRVYMDWLPAIRLF